eukprot:1401797-Rhodomonas_salina.1
MEEREVTFPFLTRPGDVGTQRNLTYKHFLGGIPKKWQRSATEEEKEAAGGRRAVTVEMDDGDEDLDCQKPKGQ